MQQFENFEVIKLDYLWCTCFSRQKQFEFEEIVGDSEDENWHELNSARGNQKRKKTQRWGTQREGGSMQFWNWFWFWLRLASAAEASVIR